VRDIGELCIECGGNTAFGSGHFVNRVPADNGELIGFLCSDCLAIDCDQCGGKTIEYEHHENGGVLCVDCL
jgi:hypothetical protein